MVFLCIKHGISRMWANKRMIFIFYLANLLFGLVLMFPFRATLSHFIGDSLMGDRLAGAFDMDFLLEFAKENAALGGILMAMGLALLIIYLLLNLFLSGGAYAVFFKEASYTGAEFWGKSAFFFGRFFRLALWGAPILIILFSLQFLESGIQRLIFGSDPSEAIIYWGKWARLVMRWFAIFLFLIILDYGRIFTVVTGEQNMRKAISQSLRFIVKNFRRTFVLAFSLSLTGVIALVIYNPLADLFSAPGALVVLMLFIWQQVFILFRMMLRLTLYSSQMQLFRNLSVDVNSGEIGINLSGESPAAE